MARTSAMFTSSTQEDREPREKASLAAGEAVGDVLTLGLTEVLFTPAEAATRNSKHTVMFCYGPDHKLVSVNESDMKVDN